VTAASGTFRQDPAEGKVAGRIFAGGLPQAEATVLVAQGSADHPDIAALTGDDGQYQLGGLSAGRYTIEARLGQRTVRHQVQLAAGEEAAVDFTFD
jgi:hypothetical protein